MKPFIAKKLGNAVTTSFIMTNSASAHGISSSIADIQYRELNKKDKIIRLLTLTLTTCTSKKITILRFNRASSVVHQAYTYSLQPTFKYSDKLDCYVDDISALDPNIPGPHQPPTKKAEIFNSADYIDVDNRAVNTPTKFYRQPLKDLVNYLIAGYDDEMSKIRVIYRWITGQPIDHLPLEKKPPKSHVLFELWRIKTKEKSYAELVSKLCRYAGIPCVIIHGAVKGSTYEVGDRIDEVKHYGEWNAVLVDGHWRFVNAYWGTVTHDVINPIGDDVIKNGDSPFRLYYLCDDNYFLTDPDQFGTTHLPMCQNWQLRKDHLTQIEFETMAYVKDGYFNLHIQTLTHTQCIIVSDSNQVEIKLAIPQESSLNIDFKCRLFLLEDGVEKRKDRYVFMHRTNNNMTLTVKIRPPERHVFRFELFGKDVTIKGDIYDYDWIVIYKLIFNEGVYERKPFPPYPAIGWGPGRVAKEMGLVPLSHLSGEVDMDDYGKAEIKFRISDTTRMGELFFAAMVFTGGETMEERPDYCVHLVENGDIIFNVMTPEKGEFVIKLTVKDSPDGNLQEFCDFLLISNQKDENGRFPKGFQERTENNVKSDLTFKQEAQTFEIIDETTDESMNKADTEEPIEESEKLNDVLRRRMCQSIEENSPKELSSVIKDMKALEEPSIQPDIIYGEESLQLLELKKELLERIRDRDIKLIEATLKKVKIVGLENKLEKEVTIARNLLQRFKKLQWLLHAVLDLDRSTIAEIRGYNSPPIIVHAVMMSTLLLLGHWANETKEWKNVQMVLGKTGHESLKRLIIEFKIETCPLEVAIGAGDFLPEYSIDQIREVSAGCATFFVWVKAVVEEVQKRAGEEINNIRPLTTGPRKRCKKKRKMTFLEDLDITSAR